MAYDRVAAFARDWRHYLAVVQLKPGALRNGAPFTELPTSFKRLQQILLRRDGGDREMADDCRDAGGRAKQEARADILALVLHHDEHLVEQAVRESIETDIISKIHILNRLSRLLDTPVPATLTPPPALTLTEEPIANTVSTDKVN